MPVADSNPLILEWCNFVSQYKYLGTVNAQLRIDEQFVLAYTDIHALLQLAINLETTHAEHVHLDANPPRFLLLSMQASQINLPQAMLVMLCSLVKTSWQTVQLR